MPDACAEQWPAVILADGLVCIQVQAGARRWAGAGGNHSQLAYIHGRCAEELAVWSLQLFCTLDPPPGAACSSLTGTATLAKRCIVCITVCVCVCVLVLLAVQSC
jgi:hypothetical protein